MNKLQTKKRKNKKCVALAGTSKEFGEENPDSIPMSKQLNIKKQTKFKVKKTPLKRKINKQSSRRQSKPMPTFSDLEKMFDDSEIIDITSKLECDTNKVNPNPIQIGRNTSFEENVPDSKIIHNQNVVLSIDDDIQLPIIDTNVSTPNDTINCDDSMKTVDFIETLLPKAIDCKEIIVIDDEEPEIILTQERKRKISTSKDGDELILQTEFPDDAQPQKIRKLSVSGDKCHLINNDNEGSDSDVTVIYDIETPPKGSPLRSSSPSKRFSPLPSTSTDSATILENDKIFMKSLTENESSLTIEKTNKDQDQITIIIDDDDPKLNHESKNLENNVEENLTVEANSDNADDLILTSYNSDEIVDIDAIIAENETILTKYKTVENLPEVIEVTPIQNFNRTSTENVSPNSSNTNHVNEPMPVPAQAVLTAELNPMITNQTINRSASIPASTNIETSCNITTNCNIVSSWNSNVREVNNITNTKQSPSEVSTGLNCPICLENLRSKECASTICGHIFCMACIKRALRSVKKCPTCRKTIKGSGYHRLFL